MHLFASSDAQKILERGKEKAMSEIPQRERKT